MGKPAARVGDMHVCPMMTPGTPPIPHVGGPVLPPGVPTVLIGGMPAAVMGGMATCVGPPDSIVLGSTGVLIGGQPAARMGDTCAHGGTIVVGLPTVLIGETSPGSPAVIVVGPLGGVANNPAAAAQQQAIQAQQQKQVLKSAASNGTPFCQKCAQAQAASAGNQAGWIEVVLVDPDNKPVADERYKIEFPDGSYAFGTTDENGNARIEGFDPGTCKVTFPDKDASDWKKA
jgi:uncharacterized Zn-binding protein involved in type VI secretion